MINGSELSNSLLITTILQVILEYFRAKFSLNEWKCLLNVLYLCYIHLIMYFEVHLFDLRYILFLLWWHQQFHE